MTASLLVEPAFSSVPPYTKTLGPEVAGIAELAGFAPDPEQRLALDAIFGMRADNKVASLEAAVIACRQNIKTGLFKQCALGWLFVTDQRLIVWSAHEFSTSQEAHRDLVELIEGSDPLRKRVKAIHRGNGEEGIELLTGQRVKFKARTKTGGRGLSGDKVVLDEAFALQPTHMGSLFPLLSVRPDPQVLYGSSAGLLGSAVLRGVRDRGRPGGDPRLMYLEWTDDLPGDCQEESCSHALGSPGCRLDDVARWHRANTQLGRRMTLEYVTAERRALPPGEFARERLGWWEDPPVLGGSAIDPAAWADLAAPTSAVTSPVYAISSAQDHSWSAIMVGWRTPAGKVRVEVAAYAPDRSWVPAKLKTLRDKRPGPVVASAAAKGLVADAEDAGTGAQAVADGAFADAVKAGTVEHGDHPELNTSVRSSCWRDYGDSKILDRKGDRDISPLTGAALVLYALTSGKTGPSVYEERGLVTL